jgi:hypothetical protein
MLAPIHHRHTGVPRMNVLQWGLCMALLAALVARLWGVW